MRPSGHVVTRYCGPSLPSRQLSCHRWHADMPPGVIRGATLRQRAALLRTTRIGPARTFRPAGTLRHVRDVRPAFKWIYGRIAMSERAPAAIGLNASTGFQKAR